MRVYVAEISGRAVLAFEAANDVEATTRLGDELLLRDLRVFQHKGRSLWDGVSKMHMREPVPEELEIWQTRHSSVTPSSDSNAKNWRVFLIPVVDPSKFDDDDDDRGD